MLISAGLIGVFVADMRSRQVRDLRLFAQAVTFVAVFYDGLVVPGALLLLASGTWLIVAYHGGWGFLEVPGSRGWWPCSPSSSSRATPSPGSTSCGCGA
jgi:hypothetical protein